MVEDAQTRKAPVQKLADTIAGYFAYGVMAIATLTFCFWYFIGTKIWDSVLITASDSMSMSMSMGEMVVETSPLLLSLKLAIAVLVVACPCALGLATPTAILVGTSIGAEKGILIKGGDILERVHKLDTVVFDKTGTLTIGMPQVTECISLGDITSNELLQIAASVESASNHPLAKAIITAAQQQDLPLLDEVKPGDKAGVISTLQQQEKTVAMIGDGINDAPALAQADVGISLQGSTDMAIAVY